VGGAAGPRRPRDAANVISLDQRFERFVVHHRAEPFDTLFVWLSRIGSFGIVWILIAAVVAFVLRRPTALPLTFMAVLLGESVQRIGKSLIDRQRPAFRYPDPAPLMQIPHTHSFPSGHATVSFACAGTLAAFVSRRVAIAFYVLAALIAWSRVYVGGHYPLDVLVGALIGIGIARALRLLPGALRRLRPAPPAG
jgi:undecaprenyl-diphosphatase